MRPDSADPRRWLAYARSDLALALEGQSADVCVESLFRPLSTGHRMWPAERDTMLGEVMLR